MKHLDISIEDLMNIGLNNKVKDWVEFYDMGMSMDVIEPILIYTDEQFGTRLYEQFCEATDKEK